MNFPYFISQRIRNTKNLTFSATVFKIGAASVAVGLAVLIISYAVLFGFKNSITQKIFSFGGDVQVAKIRLGNSYEEKPLTVSDSLKFKLLNIKEIDNIQFSSNRIGLLKSNGNQVGIVLKGVRSIRGGETSFKEAILEGKYLSDSAQNEILISSQISRTLQVKIGESVIGIFPPRARKFVIVGIYETGLEEIDKSFIVGNLDVLQKINGWGKDSVGKIEIFVNDKQLINNALVQINKILTFEEEAYRVSELYPQIYDWLQIIDKNVVVILILILIVASFNLVSVLIIMMMERTELIGVMKAMGSGNQLINKVFLFTGLRILILGLFLGNFFGIGFCLVQKYFKIIPLDAKNYFISYVPIELNYLNILELNILFFIIIFCSIFIPVFFITKMKPLQALKFRK